jgi:alpha-1,3-glucosyltransferase
VSQIIAPIPDRHLLHSHQSQQWLYSPSHSPSSSPALSPTSQTFGRATGSHSNRHLSFSTLMEHERPRRSSWSSTFLRNEVKVGSKGTPTGEPGLGKRWIRWMHGHGMKQWVVPSAIIASIWIRWGIGLGSYSGKFSRNYLRGCISIIAQATIPRLCMATTRHSGIGWN